MHNNILLMNGETIKIGIFIIVFVILTIIAVIRSKKTLKTEEEHHKKESIDVNVKSDAWWEARFDGMKKDYGDREVYHNKKYESMKSEYESRESFIRGMHDEMKKDLEREKKITSEKQEKIIRIESELQLYKRKIVELELQLLRILGRMPKDSLTKDEIELLEKISNSKKEE